MMAGQQNPFDALNNLLTPVAMGPVGQGADALLSFLNPNVRTVANNLGAGQPVSGDQYVGAAGDLAFDTLPFLKVGALGNAAKLALAGGIQGATTPGATPAERATKGAVEGATSAIAGKLGDVLGGALSGEGNRLSTGALNPTNSQITNFTKKHGEDIATTMANNGIAGGGLDEIRNAIQPLSDSFSKAVNGSGLTVDKNTIGSHLQQAIKEMGPMTLQSKGLLSRLGQEFQNMFGEVGDQAQYPGQVINKWRQAFDSGVKNFDPSDPLGSTVQRMAGTILRRSIQTEADGQGITGPTGQSIKDLGINISKLKDLESIAEQNIGRNAKSGLLGGGLMGLLRAAAATGIGGAIGGFPGAAIGLGIDAGGEAAVRNPYLAGVLSKGLTSAGQQASNLSPLLGMAGGAGVNALGNFLSGAGNSAGNNINENGNQNPLSIIYGNKNGQQQPVGGTQQGNQPLSGDIVNPILAGIKPDAQGNHQIPDINDLTQIPVKQSITKDQYDQLTQRNQQLTEKYGMIPFYANQIKQSQDLLDQRWDKQQQVNNQYINQHQLTGDNKDFVQNFSAYNTLADRLRKELVTAPPNILLSNKTLSDLKQYQDGKYAGLASDLKLFYDLSGRQIQGGVLRGFDVSQGINPAPNIGMSLTEAMTKLNTLHEAALGRYKDLYPAYTMSSYVEGTGR